jgi:hypothetical protein
MTKLMKRLLVKYLCGITLLAPTLAQAIIIESQLSDLGANRFELHYSLTNDELASGIEGFTIYFDIAIFSNLEITSSVVGWDEIVFQPDPFLPDDGLYDALATGAGIALGETLGGFAVAFDLLPGAQLAAQVFDIYDPFDFNILSSGTISQLVPSLPPNQNVSAPNIGLLISFGVLVLCVRRQHEQ